MNRNYKVIWNASLNCFMAVSEYAKARGKSSQSSVSSNATINTTSTLSSTNAFRLTAIGLGLVAAGLTMSPQVFAAGQFNPATSGGDGVAISTCTIPTTQAYAEGSNSIAIGCDTDAGKNFNLVDRGNPYYNWNGGLKSDSGSIAIGSGSKAGDVATALGTQARAEGMSSVAIGPAAYASKNTSLAIGRQSAATADFAQAIGNVSAATGKGSLAIGHSATATGYRAIAIGSPDIEKAGTAAEQPGVVYQPLAQTQATKKDSIAFGGGAQATAENALSIGAFSAASGVKSVAIGTGAKATKDNSVVIGDGANSNVMGGVALGLNATVTGENSAAIGQKSIALAQSGASFLTNVAANATNGTVSVGKEITTGTNGTPAITRRITNVADGSLDSDAVSVAQLKKQNDVVTTNTGNISTNQQNIAKGIKFNVNEASSGGTLKKTFALGQEIKFDTDSNLTTTALPSGDGIKLALANVVNVGSGTTPVKIDGTTRTISGLSNVTFDPTTTYTGGQAATQEQLSQVNTVAAQETVVVEGRNIKVTNASNGTGGQTYTVRTDDDVEFNKVTLGSGPNTTILTSTANGLNVGGDKITNLTAGTVSATSTDAINGSQLNATNNQVSTNTGNISTNQQNIAKGIKFNVNEASSGGTLKKTFALGQEIKFDTDSNLTTTALPSGDGIKLALANVVNVGSGTTPVKIDGTTRTISGLSNVTFDPTTTYTGGQAATQEQLSQVSTVAAQETVVVEGRNIKVTNASNGTGGQTYTVRTDDDVEFNKVTLGSGPNTTILTSTANGLNVGGDKITNLTAGTVSATSTDAINGSQLNATNNQVSTNTGNISTNQQNIAKGIKFNVNEASSGGTLKKTFALGQEIKFDTDSNLTTTALPSGDGIKLALANVVNVGSGTTPVKIDGTTRTISGLSNVTFDPTTTYTGGQAATQEQLSQVSTVAAQETVVVEGRNIKVTNASNGTGGQTYTVRTDDDVEFNKVTLGSGPNTTILTSTANGLNVGGDKITNLTAGTVSATSTDAINGSQLNATNNQVSTNTGNISTNQQNIAKGIKFNVNESSSGGTLKKTFALGQEIKFDTDSNLTTTALPSGDGIKLALANVVNVGSGTTPVKIDGTTRTISGLSNVTFDPTTTYTGGQAATQEQLSQVNTVAAQETVVVEGRNIKVTNASNGTGGQTYTVRTDDDVEFNKVTLGSGPNTTILTSTANGLNVGGDKITNLTAGTVSATSTDAINGSQLNATNNQVSTNTGNISTNQQNIAKGIKFNVNEASSGGTLKKTFALGQEIKFDTDSNLTTTALPSGDGIKLALANVVNVGSGTTPVKIDGTTRTISGLSNVTFDPTTTYTGGQAATQEQLSQVNTVAAQETVVVEGRNIKVTNASNGTGGQTYTVRTDDDVEFNKVTLGSGPNTTILTSTANGLNVGGDKITNLTAGTVSATSTDAINGSQLYQAEMDITNLGFDITADNASLAPGETKDKVKLGETVKYTSADGSIVTTVADNEINFALGDNLSVGGPGQDGEDGVDGFIGVNGADGQSGIALNGANGTIGLTGPTGASGIIGVIDGVPGVNGVDGITRIVIDDIQVATMEDGMKFEGNTGDTIAKKLNQTLNIEGMLADSADASGANLRVDSDGSKLNLVMAKNLTDLDSIMINNGGPIISRTGIDMGSVDANSYPTNRITNLGKGIAGTDAVNRDQLDELTTDLTDLGLNFGGDSGNPVNRKLGETLTVKGGDTINADPATKNISVTANGEDTLTVRLAKDINLGETGSVTTGNTQVNNAGITLYRGGNGQVALTNNGLNNGNNKITNVAQGTTSKDAVNFDQLSLTNTNVSTNAAGIKTNKDNIAKGIKIGDGDSANDQQFALGDTINVTGDSNITTIASATGVQVKLNNQLNLGDDGRMQMGNSIINNTGFTFVGNEPGRTVILGAGGLNNGFNRITNVAAGLAPTDAATVGQLSAATFALDRGWALSAQGDEATMVKQGSAFDLNSRDGNIKISRTAAASSVGRVSRAVDPNDMTFDLNRDIAIDSVQTGDTTINNEGLTIVGGPSVTKAGINAADTKVTNVVNGEVAANSKDAINGGQLYAQGAGISSIIGGNTTYDPVTGTFTNSNIGGTGQASIDGAIASIKRGEAVMTESIQTNTTNITTNTSNITRNTANIATNTANISTNTTNIKANTDKIDAGLNFGADSGAIINKPIGDGSVMSFKGGNNIKTTAEGSSIKFDLNGNINVESVTTGNTTVNNSGMTIKNGPSMTAAGIYAGNTETAPSMTTAGINAAGTKVTNVADGMAPRDAVNYGQLEAVTRGLGGSINELGYKIGEVEDDANAGISAAMAMSSLPQAYIIGKPMIGGGIATFNGESAVAIGFSKMSNDGRWVMKLNGTADTQGNVGGAIGAGFHFD
ncbi:YadA-like family protein [Psychrobacter pulmonis]